MTLPLAVAVAVRAGAMMAAPQMRCHMTAPERVCCLLVLNLVSSTLSCIRQPRPLYQALSRDSASGAGVKRGYGKEW
jgi:hypothetical protein